MYIHESSSHKDILMAYYLQPPDLTREILQSIAGSTDMGGSSQSVGSFLSDLLPVARLELDREAWAYWVASYLDSGTMGQEEDSCRTMAEPLGYVLASQCTEHSHHLA